MRVIAEDCYPALESSQPAADAQARAVSDSAWVWAARAFRREFLEFRFDYPLEAVPDAAAENSLHYHIASDRLFLDDLVFDRQGIAMRNYRAQGAQYNPVFVAWWGLVNLERSLRRQDEAAQRTFLLQVEWLTQHAVQREDGAVVWPCHFDWQEGHCRLSAPWISAMYQGVVISALVRAYRLTHDEALLELCEKGTRVFEQRIEHGGVQSAEDGVILYEEYPGYPLARVLDGFMFSLLGLYDLSVQTGLPRVTRLFSRGIEGLEATIEFWNYRNKWSWYGRRAYLCPPHYHKLNCVLLSVLGRVTGNEKLKWYAGLWDVRTLSPAEMAEIYLMFMVTKNVARLSLPRN